MPSTRPSHQRRPLRSARPQSRHEAVRGSSVPRSSRSPAPRPAISPAHGGAAGHARTPAPVPGLQVGIAFNGAVVPQDTAHSEAIESRGLADADLQRKRVLAGGIDDRRAPVRFSPAAPDFLLAAEHLEGHGHDGARRAVAKRDLVDRHIVRARSTVTSSNGDADVTVGCTSGTGEKSSSESTIGSTPYRSRSLTRTGSVPSRTVATGTVF